MIELKGLCKSFEEKEVLTDINATFETERPILLLARAVLENRTDEMYRRPADTRKR